ncbi:MAG: substrate-binding domain-containing protein, partial [Lachnospiraceae bacterium]|nr:substrate-binding domain-containing protein [Lachnospiraceae bacterium]
MKKRILAALLSSAMVVTLLAGCGGAAAPAASDGGAATESGSAAGAKVGVSMPTKDLQRWNQDGANMEAELKAAGFDVDLQFASNDVQTQVSQVENMISSGCSVLVIAAIEGSSLGEALDMAKEANIPVIAYDRLIMNHDAVSYYATFDNYKVGTVQGT